MRLPRFAWVRSAGLLAAAGALSALLLSGQSRVQFTGVPLLRLPLPGAAVRAPAFLLETAPGATAVSRSPASVPGPSALVEDGPFEPVPRIGADGRRPFLAYARPFDLDDQRPKIALMVVGLGLQAELTAMAIGLPGEISLHFSAYATDLPGWIERARRSGHEILLDLPMEPSDYPASDPGPHTLLASASTEDNLKRLDWLLARATGYIAVAGSGARFATSEHASPVLDALARRGLAMVEIGQANLAPGAAAVGLPYASAPIAIDADPSVPSIDHTLARIEVDALQRGSAVGIAQGYPVSLERLRRWALTLPGKGLALAPVSAVVIEQSGLAGEGRGDAEADGRGEG